MELRHGLETKKKKMQNKEFNRRNWFDKKRCELCGKQGTTFRLIKNRHLILCDSKLCDYKSRIRAGFFNKELNLKIK